MATTTPGRRARFIGYSPAQAVVAALDADSRLAERRPHLAGVVGAALCHHALASGWITRIGTGRAVALTDPGRDALHEHLGLVAR